MEHAFDSPTLLTDQGLSLSVQFPAKFGIPAILRWREFQIFPRFLSSLVYPHVKKYLPYFQILIIAGSSRDYHPSITAKMMEIGLVERSNEL